MTALIVGMEMKLIWRLFVYHDNPVNVANTILHRMQVSLVWATAPLMWEQRTIFKQMWWT